MSRQTPDPAAIAWIDGRWGAPTELGVPLQDRGLLLADGLFETVLVEAGQPVLLEAHLRRWRESATALAMATPPDAAALEPLIREAIERAGLNADPDRRGADNSSEPRNDPHELKRCGALRLNWSRGDGSGRGIDLPVPNSDPGRGGIDHHGHRFWLQLSPFTPAFTPQTAHISRHERRNGSSRLSRCKTFAYGQAIQARREAREAGADEALLLGTTGDLSCGAVANLLVRRHGRWLTPPLSSGCLAGVMRARALELGLAEEAELRWE
ncbi:MAG: aminotransferase class IV, partial [Vulcanococcus sp.]